MSSSSFRISAADRARLRRGGTPIEPSDDGDRPLTDFAGGQFGCAGHLIGNCRNRHDQGVAVGVVSAFERVEGRESGASDGDVRLPHAPCPPCGVADDDGHLHAGALADGRPDVARDAVRIARERQHGSLRDVRGVHPGGTSVSPW